MKNRYGKLTPIKPVGASQYRFRCDCKQEFVFPAGLDDYHCPCDVPGLAEVVAVEETPWQRHERLIEKAAREGIQVTAVTPEQIAETAKPKRRGRPRKA